MHPGPDERGRRDRRRRRRRRRGRSSRTRSPTASRSGWRCCTCWPAPHERRRRRVTRSATGRPRHQPRAGLVDPAAGREGAGEIVVRDGSSRRVTWLEGADADGVDAGRHRRRARLHRPPRAPARARQRGCRDDRDGAGRGGARRVHDGLRDAEHDAGARRARGARPGARGRRGVRVAGRAARPRRGDRRAGRGDLAALGELADAGVVGLLRRRGAGPVGSILRARARLRGRARAADRRPPRGPGADRGRGGERGFVATVLGLRGWPAAAEAAPSRATSRCSPRSSATCPARGST